MSHDPDYLVALDIQQRWNAESNENDAPEIVNFKVPPPFKHSNPTKRSNPHSNLDPEFLNRTQNLVHPQWETLDPTPDVLTLFRAFDLKFFQGRLECVTLEWSKRMYACAGICYFQENRYGQEITIRLSEPLLKLRPRKDLIETMLHEMIHAYLFILKIREGNGGHGPNFKKIMYGINKVAGTNITVYHSFHDEVEVYLQHWWRCNGSCQNRAPFFGYVKRTTNRAPGPNDQWWSAHMQSCGGTFMKIKSPENKERKIPKTKKLQLLKNQNAGTDLRNFFPTTSANKSITNGSGNKINGFTSGSGSKGTIKMNGGGTVVVNPKTKYPATTTKNSTTNIAPPTNPSSIATAFPPTSYPGLSSDPFNTNAVGSKHRSPSIALAGGNLSNVVGLHDLNSQANVRKNSTPTFDTTSSGYSLTNSNSANRGKPTTTDGQVDRNHLRDLWTNRFGSNGSGAGCGNGNSASNKSGSSTKKIGDINNFTPTDSAKRRRLSSEGSSIYIADDMKNKPDTKRNTNAWIIVDDDIMLQDKPEEVIALSSASDNDSDDSDVEALSTVPRQIPIKLSANERQTAIKQEILDANTNKTLTDDDIVLIDDDYDDTEAINTAATELADTSLIDDLFGEDTLLKEFKRENDVVPSGSRYLPKPEDDIITCPICQGKMKRSQLYEHLDGCTGIAVKVQLSKNALHKLASKSKVLKPSRPSRKSKKDLLRDAGYTEEDLANITSEEENVLSDSESIHCISSSPSSSNAILNLDSPEEFPRRHRQRNLFKTTRQCPVCAQEIEEDEINDHLDVCLSK